MFYLLFDFVWVLALGSGESWFCYLWLPISAVSFVLCVGVFYKLLIELFMQKSGCCGRLNHEFSAKKLANILTSYFPIQL